MYIIRRGRILHTRNQHLGNHRGFSVALPDGLSVAFSNGLSIVSGIFPRIVPCPVEFYWKFPIVFDGIFQWIFMFVRSGVAFCPDSCVRSSLHRVWG